MRISKSDKVHKFVYTDTELEDSKVVPEDVFYKNNKRHYKQFYKGQRVPTKVFEDVLGSEEEVKETKEVKVVETKTPPKSKTTKKIDSKESKTTAEKTRKKRAKSIVKNDK